MTLKSTVDEVRSLIAEISRDLDKADKGNKSASQRVRTATIRFEKIAKIYRKESMKHDRENLKKSKRPPSKGTKKKKTTALKTKTPR